jgi:hypothetical protein
MESGPDLVGRVGAPFPLIAHYQRATGDDTGDPGQADPLPNAAHGYKGIRGVAADG